MASAKKITKEVTTGVELTLTKEEAQLIHSIIGKMSNHKYRVFTGKELPAFDMSIYHIYDQLDEALKG